MSIQRYESMGGLPLSRMVRAGGFVFFSGQIPVDSQGQVVTGDIKEQTKAVFERMRESLAEVGLGFEDVIKATVWLSDLSMFGDFNEVYGSYFAGALPTRSTVEAKLAKGVDVEIEIQALDR